MNQALTARAFGTTFIVNGQTIQGIHPGLYGDTSRITGDTTNLIGDASAIWGDVSRITGEVSTALHGDVSLLAGDVSRVSGEASVVSGNLDECEITNTDRENFVDLSTLVPAA